MCGCLVVGGKLKTAGIQVTGYVQNVTPAERYTPAYISNLNKLDLDNRAFGSRNTQYSSPDRYSDAMVTLTAIMRVTLPNMRSAQRCDA